MAFIKKITQPGNTLTGSLNGRIVLDEGRGRIAVTDQDGNERTVQDIEGFHLTDGTVQTNITPSYIVQNDGTNDRIFLGDDA